MAQTQNASLRIEEPAVQFLIGRLAVKKAFPRDDAAQTTLVRENPYIFIERTPDFISSTHLQQRRLSPEPPTFEEMPRIFA